MDVIVSALTGSSGSLSSPQDRFLIMAAEMEQSNGGGGTDLSLFWKDIPKAKVVEHR